jgi:PIN like domain
VKRHFKEWYSPSEEELKQLWLKGTIVLDSNVLLQLYQYAPATLTEFFSVLDKAKERLWLPHQVGVEYHRNRAKSLPQQRFVLERVIKRIEEMLRQVDTLGLPEYHPVLDIQAAETGREAVSLAFDVLLSAFPGSTP